MGLSSNILWHQTTIDGLKSILDNKGFFYSYSLETIISTKTQLKVAIPMVSFCDLPLSEIGAYLKKYGGYSIGLSQKWGNEKGLSPVWYCGKSSSILEIQIERFKDVGGKSGAKDINFKHFLYLFSYIKNYEGELLKRGYKNYRFYDEREFRIIPTAHELAAVKKKQFLILKKYEEYKEANQSSLIKEIKLSFDWDDIRYIIVDKDKNIDDIKEKIKIASGRDNLRINYFTNKQIKEDIIGLDHDFT
ncbi:MAG: abortive infection system antitoxin AbiGi family protein [Bacteroides xylanisolvens]